MKVGKDMDDKKIDKTSLYVTLALSVALCTSWVWMALAVALAWLLAGAGPQTVAAGVVIGALAALAFGARVSWCQYREWNPPA